MTTTVRERDNRAAAAAWAGPPPRARRRVPAQRGAGLAAALVSGAAFGTSGTFGDGLLRAGWSPGAAVLARIAVAALVLTPFAVARLRGQWRVLRASARQILGYGLIGVLGCTFCYFCALKTIGVGVGLLLEYTGAIMVIGWLWLARGQRPRRLTLAGAAAAVAGLALMAGIAGSGGLSPAGFGWGLAAAVCMTVFMFICDRPAESAAISRPTSGAAPPAAGTAPAAPAAGTAPAAPAARAAGEAGSQAAPGRPQELSPVVLSWAGICVAVIALAALGAARVVPMAATTADVEFAGHPVSWIWPVLAVGALSTAAGFISAVAAIRSLGPKLASFVGMSEIGFAAAFAWLMLGQMPTATQFAGSALIMAGVILVRLDEREPDF